MPPSFGLSHLRTKTKPKHTYDERLQALSIVEEEDRVALASQWRNAHRPITRSGGVVVGIRETVTSGHPPAVDLTLRSTTASTNRGRPALLSTEKRHPVPAPPAPPISGGFLSPATTVVRGPMSYLEDPRTARLGHNEYVMYFRSTVHDADVARGLVASAPSNKKGKGAHSAASLRDEPHHNASTENNTTPSLVSKSGSHRPPLPHSPNAYQQPEFDELKSTSTLHPTANKTVPPALLVMPKHGGGPLSNVSPASPVSPLPSDAWAASLQETSMMSIPTILLNHQQRQELGVTAGIAPASPLWDDDVDDDDDLDDDLDDLGFSPSSSKRAAAANAKRRAAKKPKRSLNNSAKLASTGSLMSSNQQEAASLSFTAAGAPGTQRPVPGLAFQGHLPKFDEHAGKAPPSATGAFASSTSGRGSSTSRRELGSSRHRAASNEAGTLPDHVIDRTRLRQHKFKYAAPDIDVTTLKPKCAALHVKLEKISQRMKSEDDDFNDFLSGYLSKLRPY
jgi:hypothetical protein